MHFIQVTILQRESILVLLLRWNFLPALAFVKTKVLEESIVVDISLTVARINEKIAPK